MKNLTKRYYKITEVAALFAVEEHTLRYYETEFPTLLIPKRDKGGRRIYTPDDIRMVAQILKLKAEGLKLEDIGEELLTLPTRQMEVRKLIGKLQEMRAFLEALKREL